MSTTGDNIKADIQEFITNYATKAFHNQDLRWILLRMVEWIDSGGTTGLIVNVPNIHPVVAADFTTSIDCPLPAFNGLSLQIFYDAAGRFLKKADGEWADYPGGGFTVLLPGFDKSTTAANFYVYIST